MRDEVGCRVAPHLKSLPDLTPTKRKASNQAIGACDIILSPIYMCSPAATQVKIALSKIIFHLWRDRDLTINNYVDRRGKVKHKIEEKGGAGGRG